MGRLASAFLYSCLFVLLAALASPAQAQDYYYGGGYTHYRDYNVGYYRPHRDGHVWYSSSCCYRKVVRHVRTVHYERADEGYPTYRGGYYGHPYRYGYYEHPYHHRTYGHPYRYGYYEHPYYGHRTYEHLYRYGYYEHPYYGRRYVHDYGYRRYDSDYFYRPYRHYDLGYDSVGYRRYAGCRLIPLADGYGGWLPSRRAGCFHHAIW